MEQKQMPEIPQNWDFFMCKIDNELASIRTNLALYSVAPIEGYTQRLQFYVEMRNPTEEGLSSQEEYPILCDIEDAIGEKAEKENAILAGVVKSAGFLELWFYTNNEPEALLKACEEGMKNFDGYFYGHNVAEDKNWDCYFNFLYPDPYSYQTMQNRKVIRQLQENGDKLEVPREIDHFIYFQQEAQQRVFAKEAENKGFTVTINKHEDVEARRAEGHIFCYMVQATRKDTPKDIDNIVWDIVELAQTLDGEYDGWGCPIMP